MQFPRLSRHPSRGRRGALHPSATLFEAWVGDDDPDPEKDTGVPRNCARLTGRGCRLRSNCTATATSCSVRGFCASAMTAAACSRIRWWRSSMGEPVACSRTVDALCTDDHPYQEFAQPVCAARDWQQRFPCPCRARTGSCWPNEARARQPAAHITDTHGTRHHGRDPACGSRGVSVSPVVRRMILRPTRTARACTTSTPRAVRHSASCSASWYEAWELSELRGRRVPVARAAAPGVSALDSRAGCAPRSVLLRPGARRPPGVRPWP